MRATAFFSSALILLAACGKREARPDVLLFVVDTLRADHCSVYGYSRKTTPELERIAAEGVVFDTTYAPMGTTGPSHASLFTSRYPVAHGLVRNGQGLPEKARTLAEILTEHGWRTAAFVSSFPLARRFGFGQGFEHYDDRFDPASSSMGKEEWEGEHVEGGFDRRPAQTTAAAEKWLREAAADPAPFFVWVHHFDPHGPWNPPPEHAARFVRKGMSEQELGIAMYDAEVSSVDEQIGRFLRFYEEQRPGRDLLVIVTADHGEGLWDHGWRSHNRYTYDEELRVPLIIRWKGHLPAGKRCAEPAQIVDLMPTIADALHVDLGPGQAGKSLLPFARGSAQPEPERPLFLSRPYYAEGRPEFGEKGPGFGIREGRWKYFEAPEEGKRELYDIDSDPRERKNLAAEDPEKADELSRRIAKWLSTQPLSDLDGSGNFSEEVQRGLRALGYAGEEGQGGK